MAVSLDSLLASVFPGLAARRLFARARLEQAQRLYESVATQRMRPRRGSAASANAVMDNAQGRLREYARWLDENHDLAIGVLDDLVNNVIGTGVGVEPMARNASGGPVEKVNEQLRDLWRDWWKSPEITGEIPGPEVERLVCRSWLRDGELFVQHATTPTAVRDKSLPYTIIPMEADYVPFDLYNANDRTTHGIDHDGFGRPIAYHVYKSHPGNIGLTGSMLGITVDKVVVGAANMTHLKFVRRFHQVRGASVLHGVFTRLDDLKDYEESERIAARVAAAFTAYIKKPDLGDVPTDSTTGDRLLEMAPGMVFDNLLPGEEVGTIDTQRPNNDVDDYIAIQERRVAAGTGTRYSSISKNYNGTYSAQRQELVEGAASYRRLFNYLALRFYAPIWMRFVDAAILSRRLTLTPGTVPESLYFPELRPPSLPWIDLYKEVQAYALAREHGFKARQQIIRDLGGDPREVDALLAADAYTSPAGGATAETSSPDASAANPNDEDEEEEAA